MEELYVEVDNCDDEEDWQRIFLSCTISRRALRLTKTSMEWVPEAISPGVK
jgi:hypothetical protein